MKTLHVMLCGLAILLLSSFTPSEACNYAGSNMKYIKARTEEALEMNDINRARFYTYKAIKVIQTSTDKFNACGCAEAEVNIEESLLNLKASTKSTSLNGTKILLHVALEQINDALDAFDQHSMHDTSYKSKDFETKTKVDLKNEESELESNRNALYEKIDLSLVRYTYSINKVVDSVNCIEAKAFAHNIFINCEQQLLNANLSEGKKYYNLRTKEITEKALARIGDCDLSK